MPDFNPIIAFILETGGAWAILLFLLGYLYWAANKRNIELQKEATDHINGLHEKRIGDMQRMNTALSEFEKTLDASITSQGEITRSINELSRSAMHQAEEIKNLLRDGEGRS